MGNLSSNVTSGLKGQLDSDSRDVYRLTDAGGGGELVKLAKEALASNDYTALDEKILLEIPKFLYNGGQGKQCTIAEVIQFRYLERTGNDISRLIAAKELKQLRLQRRPGVFDRIKAKIAEWQAPEEEVTDELELFYGTNDNKPKKMVPPPEPTVKDVCWKLTERGSVGETVLHVCFLCGSAMHIAVVKRIVKYFPKTINEFTCAMSTTLLEYLLLAKSKPTFGILFTLGENTLHMAIVHEDPSMVRFLLSHGADVHQRCCGKFFTPIDQKTSRTDSVDHEYVALSAKTNYGGQLYWGEYPLSFAACLSQEESFRLLIAHGSDPNRQDANGNTVLHIMVIHELPRMFDLAVHLGADLQMKNRQGLTPLTLATKLAKKEMFNHILEIESELIWTYSGIACSSYPLRHTDSIDQDTGKINRNSSLALILYEGTGKHLELLNEFVEQLIKKKWDTYARKRLFRQLIIFSIYYLVCMATFILRPTAYMQYVDNYGPIDANFSVATIDAIENTCYLKQRLTMKDDIRFYLGILSPLGALAYLIQAAVAIKYTGYKLYFESLYGFPGKASFLSGCVLTILARFMRLLCWQDVENVVAIIASILLAMHFLFFCRGFKLTGPSVLMVYKIVSGDLVKFFVIYMIIVLGFAQSFFVIFRGYKRGDPDYSASTNHTIMNGFVESFNRMFIMSLNQFDVLFQKLRECRLSELGKFLFIVYMLLAAVMLINLLIAMLTRTYEIVSQGDKEWLRQWAAIVLNVEQMLTPAQRRLAQKKYSSPFKGEMKNRGMWLIWKQEREKVIERREQLRAEAQKALLEQQQRKMMSEQMDGIDSNIFEHYFR